MWSAICSFMKNVEKRRKIMDFIDFHFVGNKAKGRSFFGKFGVICYLEKPVLRFALLPYYPRSVILLHLHMRLPIIENFGV